MNIGNQYSQTFEKEPVSGKAILGNTIFCLYVALVEHFVSIFG